MTISKIRKFFNGSQYALELEDFQPIGGYKLFLETLCHYLGEDFLDWHQGIAEGIGHVTYKDYHLEVYWSDFPLALTFDCVDERMARDLKIHLDAFLDQPLVKRIPT